MVVGRVLQGALLGLARLRECAEQAPPKLPQEQEDDRDRRGERGDAEARLVPGGQRRVGGDDLAEHRHDDRHDPGRDEQDAQGSFGRVGQRQPDGQEGGQGEDRNQRRLGYGDDEGRRQEPGADDEQRHSAPAAVGQGARRDQGETVNGEGAPCHPRPRVAEPRRGRDLEGGEDEDGGDQPVQKPEQLPRSDGRGEHSRAGGPTIAPSILRPFVTRTQLSCSLRVPYPAAGPSAASCAKSGQSEDRDARGRRVRSDSSPSWRCALGIHSSDRAPPDARLRAHLHRTKHTNPRHPSAPFGTEQDAVRLRTQLS